MRIQVDKDSKTPLYAQIAEQIRRSILSGEAADGSLLPSERALARWICVHRNTVSRAYAELKDEGIAVSSQGSGCRVSYRKADAAELREKRRAVNWPGLIREEYLTMQQTFDDLFSKSHDAGRISFAGGMATPELYGEEEILEHLRAIIGERRQSGADYYTPYQGDPALRSQIAAFLRSKGISANPAQIQVLSETNQALDFIVSLFLSPGDTVMMEELASPDVYRPFQLAGARIIKLPMDENGILTEALEPLIQKYKPKFLYVNASCQDPTGARLSRERREKLLELSYRYRLPLIEDDAASELSFDGFSPPCLKALDSGENVIYIYSFSLTFIPGMSLAFLVAPKEVVKRMSYLVSMRMINLDWISQKLLCRYLETGVYQTRLKQCANIYNNKCNIMQKWLDKAAAFGVEYKKAKGGVYLWCRLPAGMDVKKLSQEAARQGVSFIPGEVFSPDKRGGKNHIRLNYSHPQEAEIHQGMETLTGLMAKLAHQ